MPTQELPYIALDAKAFGSVSEKDAEAAVIEAIPARHQESWATPPHRRRITLLTHRRQSCKYLESRADADPSIYFTRSRVDLAAGKVPQTEFGRRIAHSYTDHGGWYVMVFPTAYQMEYSNGIQTTHFSPWSYDRHAPLGFSRCGVRAWPLPRSLVAASRHRSYLRVDPRRQCSVRQCGPHPHPGASSVTRCCFSAKKPLHCIHAEGRQLSDRAGARKDRRHQRIPDMRVSVAGVDFRSPVIAASGTFGYGVEFEDIVSLDKIGGFVTKGLSREPMAGNQAPRIIETAAGMVNAIGLQNMGVRAFIEEKLPKLQADARRAP